MASASLTEKPRSAVGELLAGNTGAHRQLRIWEERPDLDALVADLVEASRA